MQFNFTKYVNGMLVISFEAISSFVSFVTQKSSKMQETNRNKAFVLLYFGLLHQNLCTFHKSIFVIPSYVAVLCNARLKIRTGKRIVRCTSIQHTLQHFAQLFINVKSTIQPSKQSHMSRTINNIKKKKILNQN